MPTPTHNSSLRTIFSLPATLTKYIINNKSLLVMGLLLLSDMPVNAKIEKTQDFDDLEAAMPQAVLATIAHPQKIENSNQPYLAAGDRQKPEVPSVKSKVKAEKSPQKAKKKTVNKKISTDDFKVSFIVILTCIIS